MSFLADLQEMLELTAGGLGPLLVTAVDLPAAGRAVGRDADFGSVVLSDGSVGLFYAWLDEAAGARANGESVVGRSALETVDAMIDGTLGQRALALGIANAMGQAVFQAAGWRPPDGSDTLGELALEPGDRIGMVGYFPSLVPRLQALQMPLLVVEKRSELTQESDNLVVTTELARLKACNKVICTGSVLLNDTVDEVLDHCRRADRVVMVGPSAGGLPDPLFERGCDVVGSTEVIQPALLREHLRCGQRWGAAVRKYRIDRSDYPTATTLLQRLSQARDAGVH